SSNQLKIRAPGGGITVAIPSVAQLLRYLSAGEVTMKVSQLMSRSIVTIGPSASCLEAVSRMHGARVRHLPVVDARGGLIGIVTETDVLREICRADQSCPPEVADIVVSYP